MKKYIIYSLKFLFLIGVILFTCFNLSSAQSPFDENKNTDSPWHIKSDSITFDSKNNLYKAFGNVLITNQNRQIQADYIEFNRKTMDVVASGHVTLTDGEDILYGNQLEINLNQKAGILYKGSIYLEKNHFYIHGEKIQKVDADRYKADKVTISSCDGEVPDWKITGKNLDVTVEGYGHVDHAALWIKNFPILYTPFLLFPIKLQRQTGLLAPEIGYANRKGFYYTQPFFWAINDQMDMTLYPQYLTERGGRLGIEQRYVLSSHSKGTLMLDYTKDRQIDDGTIYNEEWGYASDSYTRPNTDRFWIRGKFDQELPLKMKAKLDIDVVSDQDYLQDFDDGIFGFNRGQAYFLENFGRDIGGYDETIRSNRFNLNRNWHSIGLNADVIWFDDVIQRKWTNNDDTVHYLPRITMAGIQNHFFGPFYYSFETQYTRFYSIDGNRGHRVHTHPQIQLPINLSNYLYLESSIGLFETLWYADQFLDAEIETDKWLHREMMDFKITASTEFFRIFNFSSFKISQIKHELKPELTYLYIPKINQNDLPVYDEVDRIADKNEITYGITQFFITKSHPKPKKETGPNQSQEPVHYNYNHLLRFKIEQSYDITEALANGPDEYKNGESQEPFSDIFAEILFQPHAFFNLNVDGQWSVYSHQFSNHHTTVSLLDDRGDQLDFTYSYQYKSIESIIYSARFKITTPLSLYANYERNLLENQDIEIKSGLIYNAQCWKIDVSYKKEQEDRTAAFLVELKGLGSLDTKY